MSAPIVLDLDAPIASLMAATGATAYGVGKALGAERGQSAEGASAARSGGRVQVDTVVRAARGLGYRVELRLVREGG